MLIFVCSFSLFAQSSVTKEEYAVYARVLRYIRLENLEQSKTAFSFVILDDTFKPKDITEYKNGRFRSLSKDFKLKNLTSSKLEKSFPVNYDYEITNQSQIDELLKIGGKEFERIEAEYKLRNIGITDKNSFVWEPFYAKYPNADGYYRFSRVGFSSGKIFALVSVEGQGGFWSSNMECILKKTNGKWIIYQVGSSFGIT